MPHTYACKYTHVHTCMCATIHPPNRMRTRTYTLTYTHMHKHAHTHTFARTHACTHAFTSMRMRTHAHWKTCMHTSSLQHSQVRADTHTYIHVCRRTRLPASTKVIRGRLASACMTNTLDNITSLHKSTQTPWHMTHAFWEADCNQGEDDEGNKS